MVAVGTHLSILDIDENYSVLTETFDDANSRNDLSENDSTLLV